MTTSRTAPHPDSRQLAALQSLSLPFYPGRAHLPPTLPVISKPQSAKFSLPAGREIPSSTPGQKGFSPFLVTETKASIILTNGKSMPATKARKNGPLCRTQIRTPALRMVSHVRVGKCGECCSCPGVGGQVDYNLETALCPTHGSVLEKELHIRPQRSSHASAGVQGLAAKEPVPQPSQNT
jgi:hypothetical protein